LSNPSKPQPQARIHPGLKALEDGTLAATLIASGQHECEWLFQPWFVACLTVELADELIETFRDALYTSIRPQG
jgi:hypothetical protein